MLTVLLRRIGLTLTGLALSGVALAQAPVPSQVEQAAGRYITRAALEAPIRFLSSDLLEGRGPATRELKKYHQPSDELDGTWNFDGMIEDAQLALLAGWLIAQADAMPAWKPGDEFEAARKRELAALGGN